MRHVEYSPQRMTSSVCHRRERISKADTGNSGSIMHLLSGFHVLPIFYGSGKILKNKLNSPDTKAISKIVLPGTAKCLHSMSQDIHACTRSKPRRHCRSQGRVHNGYIRNNLAVEKA